MSDFRFGVEGYSLNYYPHDGVYDEQDCIDWSKVECVEIDWVTFVQKNGTCEWVLEHSGTLYDKWRCSSCGFLFVEPRCDQGYTDLEPNYCPNCGAKVVR